MWFLVLSDKEKILLKHILEEYLGETYENVVKAESLKCEKPLHMEKDAIEKLIGRLP